MELSLIDGRTYLMYSIPYPIEQGIREQEMSSKQRYLPPTLPLLLQMPPRHIQGLTSALSIPVY